MHKLVALVIALSTIASATQRAPLATILGPPGMNAVYPKVAAENGILAIGYVNIEPAQVYLYSIPNWDAPIATLTISDPNAIIDSVAIQNAYIAVGAQDDSTGLGSVYVFVKPEGGWSSEKETATLLPSNPSNGDGFGYSVSLWGNTLLASSGLGAAYLFIEPKGGWVDATENAQLTPSDSPPEFGSPVSLTGSVGAGGSLAVVSAVSSEQSPNSLVYVYTEPQGGWASMTQTAKLNAGKTCSCGVSVSVAKSTIAVSTGTFHGNEPPPQIAIFTEPQGGWANSSSPNFTASASNAEGFSSPTLSQDAEVLVSGYGFSNFQKKEADLAYLWHSDKDFGSSPITLSAAGLTRELIAATVTADYAFAWDVFGNVFVFNGK
ncbi:MAG TPA: hypothetical protein VF753_08120 [Terriglobales bacterium]